MDLAAVHSHILFGLLIIHITIVIFLLPSDLYDLSSKPAQAFNYGKNVGNVDLEGLKVYISLIMHGFCVLSSTASLISSSVSKIQKIMTSIGVVVILFFNMWFNIAGTICLWIHRVRNFPQGYARSIQATAVLSSVALLINFLTIILYSYISAERNRCSGDTVLNQQKQKSCERSHDGAKMEVSAPDDDQQKERKENKAATTSNENSNEVVTKTTQPIRSQEQTFSMDQNVSTLNMSDDQYFQVH